MRQRSARPAFRRTTLCNGLATLSRAALPAELDDSHTNLGWDDELDGFVTHSLPDGARLGLRLRDLTLTAFGGEGGDRRARFRSLAIAALEVL